MNSNKIEVDKEDFLTALGAWYRYLDEYGDTDSEDFDRILKKYNLSIKDIIL